MTVAWNRTTLGASRNEPLKMCKTHSVLGRAQYMDIGGGTILKVRGPRYCIVGKFGGELNLADWRTA